MNDTPDDLAPEWEISAVDAAAAWVGGQGTLLDIRTPRERDTAHIDGTPWVPMDRIPDQCDALRSMPQPLVLYCHGGVRSLRAAAFLRHEGIPARSMAGGIDAWSKQVDPSVPRY